MQQGREFSSFAIIAKKKKSISKIAPEIVDKLPVFKKQSLRLDQGEGGEEKKGIAEIKKGMGLHIHGDMGGWVIPWFMGRVLPSTDPPLPFPSLTPRPPSEATRQVVRVFLSSDGPMGAVENSEPPFLIVHMNR
jgi:hypothetical protein